MRFAFTVIALLLLPVALSAGELDQPRIWTSPDGRTLEATLLGVDAQAETARMRSLAGKIFTIKWSQLAEVDQALLHERSITSEAPPKSTKPMESKSEDSLALPKDFTLRKVPMVTQKGNFCVPASAAMIAGFHGIETDQDEVAQLSSEASISNEGTYPRDMLLAMEKLGFEGRSLHWEDKATFHQTALPAIRRALIETGPIYISFKPKVFGSMGHGCVIIGYDDRHQEMIFHNPWGNVFEKEYIDVATQGYGVVFIDPPKPAPIASEVFIETIEQHIPRFDGNFLALSARLERAGQAFDLIWCSRRDARADKRFAVDTARRDGRKILELAFERNPAVLIPKSPKGETSAYYFVTRPPEGGARFLVREITENGWSPAVLKTLGNLTREWPSSFRVKDSADLVWELPLIELRD